MSVVLVEKVKLAVCYNTPIRLSRDLYEVVEEKLENGQSIRQLKSSLFPLSL